jgi:hypothetical protein
VKDSVAYVPMERFLGPDVDLDPKQLLEILNQPGMVQQTPARLPGDQQIEVAARIGVATGHGAEHAQVVGAVPFGETKDFFAAISAQCLQCDYVSIVRQMCAAFIWSTSY